MEDNLGQVWDTFFKRRSVDLFHRFTGWYRAIVEETNDPLDFRRVRFRCPELHNKSVKVEDLPWALPAPWQGGPNSGHFPVVMIKDIVYVCFEKNHPYVAIWCASADSTRRRSYPLFSIYAQTPVAVSEDGDKIGRPKDSKDVEEFLPKDGRPMSHGISDRYGHFFWMNSVGFFPTTHRPSPAAAGTDAIAKKDFEIAKKPPELNDPDTKFVSLGTKYGHFFVFGDQGYNWKEEFEGDFLKDEDFEIARYRYFVKHLNEEQNKEHDQRRMEWRTRAGHKQEFRDVGWEKSRPGEYGDPKTIADSKERDERWMKWRTKGGHILQAIDVGFDPEKDVFYKELNKTQIGVKPDKEDDLGAKKGDDSRMWRMVTRHGNGLWLDDRGSSATKGDDKEPHGNGFLVRSRKGFQVQANDKAELDNLLIASPKDQCIEVNDRFQYVLMTTSQSSPLHTEMSNTQIRGKPRWITKPGQASDPEANTHHLKLDKQNDYIRLKTPQGAGVEMRDGQAPCGTWLEARDQENRALWFSKTDNWLLLRSKKGQKYILLDDNDDVILIRNEAGKIQIRAKDKIEILCDNGDICLEAPQGQIGMRAKSIEIATQGANHKIDGGGIGTTKVIQGAELKGFHAKLMVGLGGGFNAAKGGNPCKVDPKIITRKKPEDFDKERGCDTQKEQKGPVPEEVINSPPGGGGSSSGSGGGGGGFPAPGTPGGNPPLPLDSPLVLPPSPSEFIPSEPGAPQPLPPTPVVDPIEEFNPGGVLWYGVSAKFKEEIEENGLLLNSFSNHLNIPPNTDAIEIQLVKTIVAAKGKNQAILSKQRYGDVSLVLRIRDVPDPALLSASDNDTIIYRGNLPFDGNIEIFETGNTKFTIPPLFPNVG